DQVQRTRKYRKQSMEAQGYLNAALHYLEQALPCRREAGDHEGAGKTLHTLGQVYSALTKKELARDCYEAAVDMTREAGDCKEEGRVLHDLGRLCNALGKKERLKA